MNGGRHSFVVATYKHSPWLEACLQSLTLQRSPSPILICTSTPFPELQGIAARYGARVYVHGPNRGIGNDWNEAYGAAKTPLVTIAHQDDLYSPEFTECVLEAHDRAPHASFSFCHGVEILTDGLMRPFSLNLAIKRILINLAFLGTRVAEGNLRRLLLFGLGNPVFCPGVTLNRDVAPSFRFREDMRTNMDWLAWIELSALSGVIRIPHPLLQRRVHSTSETAACLYDGARAAEDRMVFESIWPRPLASTIATLYKLGYSGYQ